MRRIATLLLLLGCLGLHWKGTNAACCTLGQPTFTGINTYTATTGGAVLALTTCSDGPCTGTNPSGTPFSYFGNTVFQSGIPEQCCDDSNLSPDGVQQNGVAYYNPPAGSGQIWGGQIATAVYGSPVPGTSLACNAGLPVVQCNIGGIETTTCNTLKQGGANCTGDTVYDTSKAGTKVEINSTFQATCCKQATCKDLGDKGVTCDPGFKRVPANNNKNATTPTFNTDCCTAQNCKELADSGSFQCDSGFEYNNANNGQVPSTPSDFNTACCKRKGCDASLTKSPASTTVPAGPSQQVTITSTITVVTGTCTTISFNDSTGDSMVVFASGGPDVTPGLPTGVTGSCSVEPGSTQYTCSFSGEMPPGTTITIVSKPTVTVPLESAPKTFTVDGKISEGPFDAGVTNLNNNEAKSLIEVPATTCKDIKDVGGKTCTTGSEYDTTKDNDPATKDNFQTNCCVTVPCDASLSKDPASQTVPSGTTQQVTITSTITVLAGTCTTISFNDSTGDTEAKFTSSGDVTFTTPTGVTGSCSVATGSTQYTCNFSGEMPTGTIIKITSKPTVTVPQSSAPKNINVVGTITEGPFDSGVTDLTNNQAQSTVVVPPTTCKDLKSQGKECTPPPQYATENDDIVVNPPTNANFQDLCCVLRPCDAQVTKTPASQSTTAGGARRVTIDTTIKVLENTCTSITFNDSTSDADAVFASPADVTLTLPVGVTGNCVVVAGSQSYSCSFTGSMPPNTIITIRSKPTVNVPLADAPKTINVVGTILESPFEAPTSKLENNEATSVITVPSQTCKDVANAGKTCTNGKVFNNATANTPVAPGDFQNVCCRDRTCAELKPVKTCDRGTEYNPAADSTPVPPGIGEFQKTCCVAKSQTCEDLKKTGRFYCKMGKIYNTANSGKITSPGSFQTDCCRNTTCLDLYKGQECQCPAGTTYNPAANSTDANKLNFADKCCVKKPQTCDSLKYKISCGYGTIYNPLVGSKPANATTFKKDCCRKTRCKDLKATCSCPRGTLYDYTADTSPATKETFQYVCCKKSSGGCNTCGCYKPKKSCRSGWSWDDGNNHRSCGESNWHDTCCRPQRPTCGYYKGKKSCPRGMTHKSTRDHLPCSEPTYQGTCCGY